MKQAYTEEEQVEILKNLFEKMTKDTEDKEKRKIINDNFFDLI